VVSPAGTPIRRSFDRLFETAHVAAPRSYVETGSLILMRELLAGSDHLGCTSRLQAEAEIGRGLMQALPIELTETSRPIGVTLRRDWLATPAQQLFLDLLPSAEEAASPMAYNKNL
jgi:DNA-binding transcriptional LysR family regulator